METLIATFVVLAVAMALMAVGVIFSDRRLRGSCGGPAVLGTDGEAISCGDCGCHPPEADDAAGVSAK